jgi:hypothetical protein
LRKFANVAVACPAAPVYRPAMSKVMEIRGDIVVKPFPSEI